MCVHTHTCVYTNRIRARPPHEASMENEWKVDGNTFSKVKDLTIPGNKHEFQTNQCNFQGN